MEQSYDIRLVGLDLDGTVFDDQKRISAENQAAICEACRRGVQVLPATGRPLNAVPEEFLRIPGVRYALTSNGARVVDLTTGASVVELLIETPLALTALRELSRFDGSIDLFWQGKAYAEPRNIELAAARTVPELRSYIYSSRVAVDDLPAWLERQTQGPEKITMFFADPAERERCRRAAEGLGLTVSSSLPANLEMNAPGVDKGQGLLALAEVLGYTPAQVMACGDSGNDTAMLRAAGLGVAMANSTPDILALADAVTGSNNESGVAQAIQKYVLNSR